MRFRPVLTALLFSTLALLSTMTLATALDPLGATGKAVNKEAPITPPVLTLNELSADWWKPLLLSHPYYAGFMAEVSDHFTQFVETFPLEQQINFIDEVNSLQIHLTTLSGLQGKQIAPRAPSTQIKDKYSWKDFVEAMQDLRKQQIALEQAQTELKQLQEVESVISAQADTSMAKYLTQSTEERSTTLFQVLDHRLLWLIHQERLRLQQVQVTEAQQKVTIDQQIFQTAQQRLSLQPEDMQALVTERDKLPQLLDKVADLIRNKQAMLAVMVADDEQTRANAIAESLALLDAQQQEAQLNSKQLWLFVAEVYLTNHLHHDQTWLAEQRDALNQWQKDAQSLRERIQQWRNNIEKHREKAQVSLLLLEKDADPKTIQKIGKLYTKSMSTANDLIDHGKPIIRQLDDTQTLLTLIKSQLQAQDGLLKSSWLDLSTTAQQGWQITQALLDISLFKIGETPVTTAGILRVVLIITLIWWFSYWLRKGLSRLTQNNERISDSTVYTINRILHYVIMVVGVMVALSSIGLDFSNVAWIAGALSVGIGFGLQSIVNNFVSGLIIMFERSLKVGDYIELQSGVVGTVSQINMRSTIIRTADNLEIVVPNSEFISGRVVNWTLSDNYRRLRIPFSVDYGCDKENLVSCVLAAADRVPFTVKEEGKEPQVWMINMGTSGLDFELLVWVRIGADIEHAIAGSRQGVKSAYLWEVESALIEAGIEIPYPQQDLYVRSFLGAKNLAEVVDLLKQAQSPQSDKPMVQTQLG